MNTNKRNRVAVIVTAPLNNQPEQETVQEVLDFCEDEGFAIIVLAIEETKSGAISHKGYQTISKLIEEDMIDGVVTVSDDMLEGDYGDQLSMDAHKKDFFLISYEEEMMIRHAEMQQSVHCDFCDDRITIMAL